MKERDSFSDNVNRDEPDFRFFRPKKKVITFRIDMDNLLWLKGDNSSGYQGRINEVLRWARFHGCDLREM